MEEVVDCGVGGKVGGEMDGEVCGEAGGEVAPRTVAHFREWGWYVVRPADKAGKDRVVSTDEEDSRDGGAVDEEGKAGLMSELP